MSEYTFKEGVVYKPDAKWTDDCQGKKDFDGSILTISTRYWPRGGSALIFDGRSFSDGSDPSRRHIKPSAKSSLMFRYKEDENLEEYDPGYINLIAKDFEAETEEEVKQQVEQWAQEQMNRIVNILKTEFAK